MEPLKVNNTNKEIKLVKLAEVLKKYDKDFSLSKENLEDVLYGLEFGHSDNIYKIEAIAEVCDYGICVCGMSKYYIHHETEADSTDYHLICSGCERKCDGGDKYRDNTYTFESKKYGAGVFGKRNGDRVDEGYCGDCKVKELCGQCGYNLNENDKEVSFRPEYSDFVGCEFCIIDEEDRKHKEEHAGEPDLDCGGCHSGAEKGDEKTAEINKCKSV